MRLFSMLLETAPDIMYNTENRVLSGSCGLSKQKGNGYGSKIFTAAGGKVSFNRERGQLDCS